MRRNRAGPIRQRVLRLCSTASPETAAAGNPEAGLIYENGTFYRTAFDGGTANAGTVFKLVP
jgi:hypothetical protein